MPPIRGRSDGIRRYAITADRFGPAARIRVLVAPERRRFRHCGGPGLRLQGGPRFPRRRTHQAARAQGPHRGAQGVGRAQGPGGGPPQAAAGRGRVGRPQAGGREADPEGTDPPRGRKEKEDPARNGEYQEGTAPAGHGTQHGRLDHRRSLQDGHGQTPQGAPAETPEEEGSRRAQDQGSREAPGLHGPCGPYRGTSPDPKGIRCQG
mmetsp:Transcript_5174/g.15062  ORF Transcript_5174/g.15062 Transcript_5174/m.15062 type:complete len:207 (-) Transcript_5174:798-1418(-)